MSVLNSSIVAEALIAWAGNNEYSFTEVVENLAALVHIALDDGYEELVPLPSCEKAE